VSWHLPPVDVSAFDFRTSPSSIAARERTCVASRRAAAVDRPQALRPAHPQDWHRLAPATSRVTSVTSKACASPRQPPSAGRHRTSAMCDTAAVRTHRAPVHRTTPLRRACDVWNSRQRVRSCLYVPTRMRGVDVSPARCRKYLRASASLLIGTLQLCETRCSRAGGQVSTLLHMITIRSTHCSQGLLEEQRSDSRRSICTGRAMRPRAPATCGLTSRVAPRAKRKHACIRGAARIAH
jgi:hypothetical protein